jgi:hypothetical protein
METVSEAGPRSARNRTLTGPAVGLVSCLILNHPNVLSQNLHMDPPNLSHARGSAACKTDATPTDGRRTPITGRAFRWPPSPLWATGLNRSRGRALRRGAWGVGVPITDGVIHRLTRRRRTKSMAADLTNAGQHYLAIDHQRNSACRRRNRYDIRIANVCRFSKNRTWCDRRCSDDRK